MLEKKSLWNTKIMAQALVDSVRKLDPRWMVKNPVMFVVEVGSVLTTLLLVDNTMHHRPGFGFNFQITFWLWFTVLFANFAEAMAEGRGKAQADTLRKAKGETIAQKYTAAGGLEEIPSGLLRVGDVIYVEANHYIAGDGEVIEGVASVDESAITGESAPVIREAGGDRSAVTGGTKVLSDWIKVRITSNPGETFLDRMIALVEGATRQKTPNEIALSILLSGRGHVAALCHLREGAADNFCAGFAAGLPHPHHHRRTALGHRHRRHGPARSIQCAGHERTRRRGRRRREHPVAGQDRHHHPGQPPGHGVHPRPRCEPGAAG
jgi:high-affinity K+ transport system ATPase subunit B